MKQPFHRALLAGLACLTGVSGLATNLSLTLQDRVKASAEAGGSEIRHRHVTWNAAKTAVVICDMWDAHWCKGATARVAEMAPRMNQVINAMRAKGSLIIHCPSGTLDAYRDSPGRKLAQAAPAVEPKVPLQGWCSLDPSKEAALPIDDSDGGCDDWPECEQRSPWRGQIAALEIKDGDAITDSAEAYYLMRQRGIRNVVIMGVHLNMCVLGRPFGIRQLVNQDLNVVLMRDLTDTMYNSRRAPYVSHFVGTDLMIKHVEQHWCPTIASSDILGDKPFRFARDQRKTVAFVIGENEYQTWESLPQFAEKELKWRGYNLEFVMSSTNTDDFEWDNWEAIAKADVLVISARRRAMPSGMLKAMQAHLEAGHGLVGVRTASHAFAVRGSGQERVRNEPELVDWPDFDPAVLGGSYHGHYSAGPKTTLKIADAASDHPVLTGVETSDFLGIGSLYKSGPLVEDVTALLIGTIPRESAEPVAWCRRYGDARAEVFYTSLGHVDDFKQPEFRRLLLNAILWGMEEPIPPAALRKSGR